MQNYPHLPRKNVSFLREKPFQVQTNPLKILWRTASEIYKPNVQNDPRINMNWKRDAGDLSHHASPLYERLAGLDQSLPYHDLEPSCSTQRSNTLAALRLLTSYNHFLTPPEMHSMVGPLLAALPPPCVQTYCQHLPVRTATPVPPTCEDVRRRGEKRPIPPELKDEKYFERRRRNNQAAKKSRDARRIREDQIAWRACMLEQENASLRAHVAALRQEALALRGLLAAREPTQPAPSSTTPD